MEASQYLHTVCMSGHKKSFEAKKSLKNVMNEMIHRLLKSESGYVALVICRLSQKDQSNIWNAVELHTLYIEKGGSQLSRRLLENTLVIIL